MPQAAPSQVSNPLRPTAMAVSVPAPQGGNAVEILSAASGGKVTLGFDPANSTVTRHGNNLVFDTPDGSVQLTGFFSVGVDNALPSLVLPGGAEEVAASDFLAALNPDMDLATAAGGGGAGSGGTNYDDAAGDLLAGIDRLGGQATGQGNGETRPVGELPEGRPAAVDPGPAAEVYVPAAPVYSISIVPWSQPANDNTLWDNPNDVFFDGKVAPDIAPDLGSQALNLNEAHLPNGTGADPKETGGWLYFLITSNDGIQSITVEGVTYTLDTHGYLVLESDPEVYNNKGFVTFPEQDLPAGFGPVGSLSHGQITGTANPEQFILRFYYTFDSNTLAHGQNGYDTDFPGFEQFVISAASVHNTTSGQVTANINVIDDVPKIEIVPDGDSDDNGSASVSGVTTPQQGVISLTGADGVGGLKVTVNGFLEHDNIFKDSDSFSCGGSYGTLKLERSLTEIRYTYTPNGTGDSTAVEAGVPDDQKKIPPGVDQFTFTVSDGDGDRASDTLTLNAFDGLIFVGESHADLNGAYDNDLQSAELSASVVEALFSLEGSHSSYTYSLKLNTPQGKDSVPSGLHGTGNNDKGQGSEIMLSLDIETNGDGTKYVVTGFIETDDGKIETYFTLTLDNKHNMTLTLLKNIWHGDSGDPDDLMYLLQGIPDVLALVRTGPNGTTTYDLGMHSLLGFKDDGPIFEFGKKGTDTLAEHVIIGGDAVVYPSEGGKFAIGADGFKMDTAGNMGMKITDNFGNTAGGYLAGDKWVFRLGDVTITIDPATNETSVQAAAGAKAGEYHYTISITDGDLDVASDTIIVTVAADQSLELGSSISGGDDLLEAYETGIASASLSLGNSGDNGAPDGQVHVLAGNEGEDTLHGGEGKDLLYGGAGNDALDGGMDADLLYGGKGNDTLTGGGGNDTFAWAAGDLDGSTDTITDFTIGEDKLYFEGLFDSSVTTITQDAILALGDKLEFNADNTELVVHLDDGRNVTVAFENAPFSSDTDDATLLAQILTNSVGG